MVLKVGPSPDGSGARDVTVVPVASESNLRYLAWIEGNRRKVDTMTGGKLAYVHLPDTAGGGFTNFNRYYYAQLDRQGAVIDERFNGGGSAADYIVDALKKPVLSYWAAREGMDATTPAGVLQGPKVMIVNEFAGSGGDLMPWMFRRMKVGPLVGKRTWGGLVGIGGYPALVDGGSVTAPHFALLQPREPVGGGEPRRGAGHRGGSRSGRVAQGPRHPAREGGGTGDGGTDEKPAEEGRSAGVPELPQEVAHLWGLAEASPHLAFLHVSRSVIHVFDRPTLVRHPVDTCLPGAADARRPPEGSHSEHV